MSQTTVLVQNVAQFTAKCYINKILGDLTLVPMFQNRKKTFTKTDKIDLNLKLKTQDSLVQESLEYGVLLHYQDKPEGSHWQ